MKGIRESFIQKDFVNKIKNYQTVGVAGSLERIGTTTQALQIVQYLQLMGKKACYIEMNETAYLEKLIRLYSNIEINYENGSIKIGDIYLFQAKDILHAYREDFDFFIKDYGSINSNYFERLSFLEQDFKVICAGSKPNEIFNIQDILQDNSYMTAAYIFSFTPKDEQEIICEMMDYRSSNTYFAPINIDPFTYLSTANQIYKAILRE